MPILHALQLALASQPVPRRIGQGSEAILGGHLLAILRRERADVRAALLFDDAPEFCGGTLSDRAHQVLGDFDGSF